METLILMPVTSAQFMCLYYELFIVLGHTSSDYGAKYHIMTLNHDAESFLTEGKLVISIRTHEEKGPKKLLEQKQE